MMGSGPSHPNPLVEILDQLRSWYTNVVLTGHADGWSLECSEEDEDCRDVAENADFVGRTLTYESRDLLTCVGMALVDVEIEKEANRAKKG